MRFNKTVFHIALTGIMFALVLIFQFLAKFMKLVPVMEINLSLIFIALLIFLAKASYAFILLVLRFILGPLVSGSGYNRFSIFGHSILFFAGLIFLIFIYILQKKSSEKLQKNFFGKLIIISLICSLIMTVLNGVLFTPGYFWLFTNKFSFQIVKGSDFMGIKNYWAWIFAVFFTGNIIIYTLSSYILYITSKIVWKFQKS